VLCGGSTREHEQLCTLPKATLPPFVPAWSLCSSWPLLGTTNFEYKLCFHTGPKLTLQTHTHLLTTDYAPSMAESLYSDASLSYESRMRALHSEVGTNDTSLGFLNTANHRRVAERVPSEGNASRHTPPGLGALMSCHHLIASMCENFIPTDPNFKSELPSSRKAQSQILPGVHSMSAQPPKLTGHIISGIRKLSIIIALISAYSVCLPI
jgi:hypothetical protein